MPGKELKVELAILVLWLVAVIPTFLLIRDTGLFTYLGPLYFICMVASVYLIRTSRKGK